MWSFPGLLRGDVHQVVGKLVSLYFAQNGPAIFEAAFLGRKGCWHLWSTITLLYEKQTGPGT